jgi:ABC-2 type transport system ATP-binding protein
VYINAAFLGISRKEIGKRFDDIIDFAELGQFIDEPVKHYSSGMYVRLGFAVAVNVDPDVLLVDEVLAVGDESFAKKCLGRVKQFQSEGRTIIVVTHAADVVRQVCNRALVLDHGILVADTKPSEAIQIFRQHLHGSLTDDAHHESGPLRITSATISSHSMGAHLAVTVSADQAVDGVSMSLEVSDASGRMIYRVDNSQLGVPLSFRPGRSTFDFELSSSGLLRGNYPITVRLTDIDTSRLLDWHDLQTGFVASHPGVGEGVVDLGVTLQERAHPVDRAPEALVE